MELFDNWWRHNTRRRPVHWSFVLRTWFSAWTQMKRKKSWNFIFWNRLQTHVYLNKKSKLFAFGICRSRVSRYCAPIPKSTLRHKTSLTLTWIATGSTNSLFRPGRMRNMICKSCCSSVRNEVDVTLSQPAPTFKSWSSPDLTNLKNHMAPAKVADQSQMIHLQLTR